jgi:hypothetical protein
MELFLGHLVLLHEVAEAQSSSSFSMRIFWRV